MCLPPLLAYWADVTLTLLGQPGAYWQGQFSFAMESNPLGRWLLVRGPWLFVGAASCWAVVFVAILVVWKHRLAVVMAFVLTVGHALGAASWLFYYGAVGIAGGISLLVVAERLITWSWSRAGVSVVIASKQTDSESVHGIG